MVETHRANIQLTTISNAANDTGRNFGLNAAILHFMKADFALHCHNATSACMESKYSRHWGRNFYLWTQRL